MITEHYLDFFGTHWLAFAYYHQIVQAELVSVLVKNLKHLLFPLFAFVFRLLWLLWVHLWCINHFTLLNIICHRSHLRLCNLIATLQLCIYLK